MQIVTREPAEFAANLGLLPQTGTATVVPGSGAFLETSVLQELVDAPDPVQRLNALLEALKEAEAEKEYTAAMSKFRKNVTGVDNTIFFSAKFARHKPRIKVAIDPPTHVDPSADDTASVAIADGEQLAGTEMSPWLRKQVEWFLELNRATLMNYWEKRIDDDELREHLLANKAQVEAGRPR
jgi:hypothetical protein